MPVNLKTLASRISALEARSGKRDRDDLARTVALMRQIIPATAEAEPDAAAAADALGGGWWKPQRFHQKQAAAFHAPARYRAIEAGRRSGKSFGRKVEIVVKALDPDWPLPDRHIVVGARTDQQTRRLYWNDLLRMIPKRFVRAVRKSDRQIETVTGAVIHVLGMDVPQRAEGIAIDDLFLDEFADVPPEAFEEHLGPALATPGREPGTATVFGTTDMRSGEHAIKLNDEWHTKSLTDPNYAYFHWTSVGIVDAEQIEAARERMSDAAFRVEFLAERVTTGARAYYEFTREIHCRPLVYIPTRPIAFCFDFNVAPGVACVTQEQSWHDYSLSGERPEMMPEGLSETFTAVIGEVWIPEDSNTPKVVRALLDRWGDHESSVHFYGDATGGSRGTAKTDGTDWDIIDRMLRRHYGASRVHDRVPNRNPAERARVNSVNAALRNAAGKIQVVVDPEAAPQVVRDFERQLVQEGTAGELYKPSKGPNADIGHMCFSGDTLVETPTGPVAFRDLPECGMVMGPLGEFVRYINAGLTGVATPMLDVVAHGVGSIRCNPWHQVLTRERGWVRADESLGLTLVSLFTMTEPRSFLGSATSGADATSIAAITDFTGSSTPTTTVIRLPGRSGTSTTRTGIGQTTSPRTWNWSGHQSTCPTTTETPLRSGSASFAGTSPWLARRPLSGTEVQRVGLGTASMPRARRRGSGSASASSAGRSSGTFSVTLDSAARLARQRRDEIAAWMTRIGTASSAVRASGPTATGRNGPARGSVLVLSPAGTADAYCLWQPDFGCFALASGVVVSNCDGLGYRLHQKMEAADAGPIVRPW